MRGFFSVVNFDRFQHYRGRTPPWIKLYNNLLDDYAFARLPDAAKWHLVGIFLLASRYDNKIPADLDWLAKKLSASFVINLPLLQEAGFIVLDQTCSNLLADCKQLALPEREERQSRVEKEKKDSSSKPQGGSLLAIIDQASIISIPTNRFDTIGEEVGYAQAKLDEWQATYPIVDVPATMRLIRQWSIDAPTQRKTAKGMNKFINSWLARDQNRGGTNGGNKPRGEAGAARNSRFLQGIAAGIGASSEGGPEES